MMNRAVVAESRKAIDQEERLKRFAPAGIVLYPFVIYQLTIRNELQGIRSGSPVRLAFCCRLGPRSSSCLTVRMYGMTNSAQCAILVLRGPVEILQGESGLLPKLCSALFIVKNIHMDQHS